MNGKSVLGMLFANIHEEALDTLTAMRTMGSVPFCSRFRLIDFPLSNLVESGVTKIGVVTNSNFRSLMDHIGTGKPWDLSRKRDGLFLLPPFSAGSANMWGNRIDAIYGNINFLHQSHQTYVLMADCNNVMNINYSALFDAHEKSGADITIVGVKGKMPKNIGSVLCFDKVEADGRIMEMSLDRDSDEEVFYSCNIMIMKKYLLETLIQTALSKLIKNKTVIVIAHRMRTVAGADKIVVLSDGVVAEEGTAESLKKLNGIFVHMMNLQSESSNWKLN